MIIATARLGRRFYGTWFTSIWIARVWKRHYYSFRSSSSPIQDNKAHTHTHTQMPVYYCYYYYYYSKCKGRRAAWWMYSTTTTKTVCGNVLAAWTRTNKNTNGSRVREWRFVRVMLASSSSTDVRLWQRRVHTEERRGEGGMRLHLHTSHHTERGESPPPAAPRELKRKMSVRRADDTARRILAWQSSTYLSHAGPTTFKSRKIFLSFSRLFIYRNAVDAVDAVEGNKI